MRMLMSLFLLLSVNIAWAGPSKYRVGVENISYLPYYQTEKDNWSGFVRDLLDGFAAKEGIQFEYVPVPVNRLYADFLDNASTLDFKFPDNENWAGDKKVGKKVFYSESVVEFTDGTMVAKDKIGRSKDQLKTLGTVRGFTPWDYLDDVTKSKKIRLVENDTLSGLLQQAKQGRVDGVYVNISVANYALKNALKEPEALVFDKSLPHTSSTYKLSSLKHEELLKKLNAYVAQNKPAIDKLRVKWGL